MKIKSIREVKNLGGKKVFLRVDFNVPVKNGKIVDDYKIAAALPTARFLLRHKCKIIIATHLEQNQKPARNTSQSEAGGSKISARGGSAFGGKNQKYFSIKPAAKHLGKLLGKKVNFINDCIGPKVERMAKKMKEGDILMLGNLRFYGEEKENNDGFAKKLSRLADIYVNDAFGASHRKHASISAIKKYIPSYAGFLLENEILNLSKVLKPKQPAVAVMGGAKISTKLSLLKAILKSARHILLGGDLANNFLAAAGVKTGRSFIDKNMIALAKKIMFSTAGKKKIILPIDVVVSESKYGASGATVKSVDKISGRDIILDIGPETMKMYSALIKKAKTIIWNGPVGMFEVEHFRHGTLVIGRVIAAKSRGAAFGVIGGGETVEALKMTKMIDYVDWVSTGGGAMLSFLAGEKMPGLEGIVFAKSRNKR